MSILHPENKSARLLWFFKAAACLLSILFLLKNAFINGITPFLSFRDYTVQDTFDIEGSQVIPISEGASQSFTAKGNILDKIYVRTSGPASEADILNIVIADSQSNIIYENNVFFSDLTGNEYSQIEINLKGLNRDDTYTVHLSSPDTSAVLYASSQESNTLSIGFQFTYQYITAGNLLFFLLRTALIVLLGCVFCYGIINIEKLIKAFKETGKKEGWLSALYFSVCTSFIFNPLDKLRTNVTDFTREIGFGNIRGYDAAKTISNFSRWFLIFAVSFSVFFLVSNYFIKRTRSDESMRVLKFLENIFVLADVDLLFRCISFFYDESRSDAVFYYSTYLLALIIAFGISYVVFGLERKIRAKTYYELLMTGFLAAIPLTMIYPSEWDNNKLLIGIQALTCFILAAGTFCIPKAAEAAERYRVFTAAASVSALAPFITSAYIEAVNIANQYGVFIYHLRRGYIMICALLFMAFIIFSFVINKKNLQLGRCEQWINVWTVFGIGCLYQQLPLENVYLPDIFEWSNHSVLISDFLRFGKIPIVEHLGHHMLLNVWEGLIYAFLNNDYAGAIVSPYSVYASVPLMLFFYLFVKKIWDEKAAFWTTLLFPFYGFWGQYAWGILLVLAALAFIEKNTYLRSFAIWAAFVWCCLIRVDIGFSFGLAGFITLAVYVIAERNAKAFRQLFLPLAGVTVCGGILWFVLCMSKGISPIPRLIEFLKLFAATINWSWDSIGDSSKTVFGWSYMIIPFSMIIALLYTVFSGSFRKEAGKTAWAALLLLGFAYFGNFSRALSRHSLAEMRLDTVIWTGYVFLSLFIGCVFKKRKLFLPAFTVFILCNTLFLQSDNFRQGPLADVAFAWSGGFRDEWTLKRFADEDLDYVADGQAVTYWEKTAVEKDIKQRVRYTDSFITYLEPFRYITTVLLDEDETFLDFICSSYLYSEFGKPAPTYLVQSPTMMSGELTQEYYLEEIKSDLNKIPIALMPNNSGSNSTMDQIKLNYKYYEVAEFIYNNYKPLCSYDKFSVWCLNDRYDELIGRLRGYELAGLINVEFVGTENCNISKEGNIITITAAAGSPCVCDLEKSVDLSAFQDMTVSLEIEYETDKEGAMRLFYTTENDDSFSDKNSSAVQVTGKGTAHFEIPVIKDTSLKLCVPENSTTTISSVKISAFGTGVSKLESLIRSNSFTGKNCEILGNNDGTVSIIANGEAPGTVDLQEGLDLQPYEGSEVNLIVDYLTDTAGYLRLYYTSSGGEDFSAEKSVVQYIEGDGRSYFNIPAENGCRVRLETSAGSSVTIQDIAISLQSEWSLISPGFDQDQHVYSIYRLPLYWAELDEYNASENEVLCEIQSNVEGIFVFDKEAVTDKVNGNYALLTSNYPGADSGGLMEADDEYTNAVLIVGYYSDNNFVEKYRYNFTVQEGTHNYLFRISSDYYWTMDSVNAFKLECSDKLLRTGFKILQGD